MTTEEVRGSVVRVDDEDDGPARGDPMNPWRDPNEAWPVPARREDEQALWLNYALAARLVQDPTGVIEQAKTRLQRLRTIHACSETYLDQWETALNAGPGAVLAIMTSRTDHGQVMRSTSPVSGLGLLTDDERTRILTAFHAWWRSTHPAAPHLIDPLRPGR